MSIPSDLKRAIVSRALLGALIVGTICSPTPTEAQNFADPEAGVWITIGADGFGILGEAGATFLELPLVELEAAGGVVITRVHAGDLPEISARMHQAFNRCAGFMAHPSLERAQKALVAASRERVDLGGVYSIDQSLVVQSLVAAIEKPELLNTIERLSEDFNNRYHLHPSGTAAAQWIHDQWAGYAAGRSDVTVELYDHVGLNQPSVIMTIEGVSLADEVVVLGGHLDSVSFDGGGTSDPNFIAPGADDDASGIAVLSEVARVAMVTGFRPERTVQLIGYAAEEIGLVGSADIANQYADDGVDVVAVLQLDMTDFNGSNEDIGILSDHTDGALADFVGDLVDAYQPSLIWTATACGYACSDHASWDDNGFPAVMTFESRFGEHNSAIHSTSDTLATLGNSVDHAFKFASLGVAFMVEIAKESSTDIFADGFENGTMSVWDSSVP